MSLYEQIWSPSEYEPRKEVYLRDLPKNHLIKIKAVQFEWTDYKIYEKLGCVPYERMTVQCLNRYGGAKFLFEDATCRDIFKYFKDCVQVNNVLGYQKRVNPQHFATNEYSRAKPVFTELAI